VMAAVGLGDTLVAAGRVEDAIKQWDRTFRTVPRAVLIERMLSQQPNLKDRQRTVALMKKYQQEMGPDSVHILAARIALEDGDAGAAVTELDAVAQQEAPAVQRLRAQVHRTRNEMDQALQALTKLAEETGDQSTGYRCTNCGRVEPEWVGYCPACEKWDTYRSVVEAQSERSA
jgi:lipopolysaccharide biosynthesis regulator YciM